MSTTALVRSTSGTSTSLAAPRTPQKPALPSTVSTTTATQPKPTSTPQTYSAPAKPSTPQQQLSPAPSTPGRWQHPRMDEVVRRQNRTRFDQSNVFSLKYNLALLVASSISIPILNWLYVNTPSPSHKAITNTNTSLPISRILTNHQYTTYTLLALRLFFLLNIGLNSELLGRYSSNIAFRRRYYRLSTLSAHSVRNRTILVSHRPSSTLSLAV